jgi:hypothetical protein
LKQCWKSYQKKRTGANIFCISRTSFTEEWKNINGSKLTAAYDKEMEYIPALNKLFSSNSYYIPPKIVFSLTKTKRRESKSSGPRAHPKEPANVVPWDEFLSNAASFRLESSVILSSPTFVHYEEAVSDETDLQGVIKANILNPINYLLRSSGSNLRFSGHSNQF